MSRFTDFRNKFYIEIGNALIGMLLDKLRKGKDGRAEVPEPPTFHGGTDGIDGVSAGSSGVRYEKSDGESR